ncbi:MAG: hypothetical protein ABSE51_19940 [Terracidiphilus sp.]
MESNIRAALSGVENFRKFQKDSLRHQWYMKGAAAMIVVQLAVFGWIAKTGIEDIQKNLKPILEIVVEDFLKEHPEYKGQLPKISIGKPEDLPREAQYHHETAGPTFEYQVPSAH